MVTYAELQAESWYGREVQPATLVAAGDDIRIALGLPAGAIGIKGNNAHLSGGHRSPEWIWNSRYSTRGSGDGSLLMANGARMGATHPLARNLRAIDITPGAWGTPDNRQKMIAITERMDAAVKAGLLPTVRRFWGTLDGSTVYGWDTLYDRVTTANLSHLDHLHKEDYPDTAHLDQTAFVNVVIGGDMFEAPDRRAMLAILFMMRQMFWQWAPKDRATAIAAGIPADVWDYLGGMGQNALTPVINRLEREAVEDEARDLAHAEAIKGLGSTVAELATLIKTGGGSVEAAEIVVPLQQSIEAATTAAGARTQALQDELQELRTQLAAYRKAEADAARAEAAALDASPG